jgi:2-polyprenyl-3-methyl-5-hydroxy-6-metoxy-1,4-benzoquinol methylase
VPQTEIPYFALFSLFFIILCILNLIALRETLKLKRKMKDLRRAPFDVYVVARKVRAFPPVAVAVPEADSASRLADGFLKDFTPTEKNISRQRFFLKFFKRGGLVLDIGCGKGEFLQLCSENGLTGLGVDLSEQPVESCREKNLDVHYADAFSYLSDTDKMFDGVMCSHVIEHLEPEEFLGLTKLMSEKLNDGGIFVIVTPNPRSLRAHLNQFWKDLSHRRFYDIESVCYALEKGGFEIIEAGPFA